MGETKKCKYCQSEIDKKATVCPVCKRTLKGHHGCLVSILAVIVVFIGIGVLASRMNSSIQREVSGVTDDEQYITMSEYNEIQNGMTYDEVVEIVGGPGQPSVSSGSPGYQIELYTWYGNGTAGSNANVTFTNGQVTGKAQVGLK